MKDGGGLVKSGGREDKPGGTGGHVAKPGVRGVKPGGTGAHVAKPGVRGVNPGGRVVKPGRVDLRVKLDLNRKSGGDPGDK